MAGLVRFGVSLDGDLLRKFDELIREKHYSNRSEALRDLIRQELIAKEWEVGQEIAGAVPLIYARHHRELLIKVTDHQHDYQHTIISTQHVHLDHNNCLEIVAVRGEPDEVRRLAEMLKAIKGIKHCTLSMSSTGKELG